MLRDPTLQKKVPQGFQLVVVGEPEELPCRLEGWTYACRMPRRHGIALLILQHQVWRRWLLPQWYEPCIGSLDPSLHHAVEAPEMNWEPHALPRRILQPTDRTPPELDATFAGLACAACCRRCLLPPVGPCLLCKAVILRLLVLQMHHLWENRVPLDRLPTLLLFRLGPLGRVSRALKGETSPLAWLPHFRRRLPRATPDLLSVGGMLNTSLCKLEAR
mmetsp:Transcript_96630/g.250151  ORF Transcript_96630/g.250151 Transcript_96630/m.250151 type:complete len:218 (-) Transcript_96630:3-656(-)